MSHYSRNPYHPSGRRRRHRHPSSSPSLASLATTAATTAAVAYGAYCLGSWAWNSYFGDGNDKKNMFDIHDEDSESESDDDVFHEWTGGRNNLGRGQLQEFKSGDKGNHSEDNEKDYNKESDLFEEPNSNMSKTSNHRHGRKQPTKEHHYTQSSRSRRSRVDWGEKNQRDRSHRPSPAHDYQHHHEDHDRLHPHHSNHHAHHQDGGYSRQQHILEDEDRIDSDVEEMRQGALMGMEGGGSDGLRSSGTGGSLGVAGGTGGMMTKAASLATAGVGAAVNAAITGSLGSGVNKINGAKDNAGGISPFLRNARMGRCRVEVSRAMMDFLPNLKNAVVENTDVTKETEELKKLRVRRREISEEREQLENRENGSNFGGLDSSARREEMNDEEEVIRERERFLWNTVKNKSITRLITTIYSHTIVFLVLTVQVNLLGGRLLREEQEEKLLKSKDQDNSHSSETLPSSPSSPSSGNTDSGSDRFRSSYQTVLARTYKHLFAEGIPSLTEVVGKAVDDVLQEWDVLGAYVSDSCQNESGVGNGNKVWKDDASLDDISSWMERVRDIVEMRREKGSTSSPLVPFVIPPDGDGNDDENKITDEIARYILDETYDLLESPTYTCAESICLDATFAQLREEGYAKLFADGNEDNAEKKPLVNVVTHLQKTAVGTFHRPPSHKEEMASWGGVLGMMEEPLPTVPNVYIPKIERLDGVLELGDVCFD